MDENPRVDLEAYRAARELHADEQRMQEIKAAQRRYRRDARIAWALAAITLAALSAYFLGVNPQPHAASADACPGASAQLNAYERELQQRECEARRHNLRAKEVMN